MIKATTDKSALIFQQLQGQKHDTNQIYGYEHAFCKFKITMLTFLRKSISDQPNKFHKREIWCHSNGHIRKS